MNIPNSNASVTNPADRSDRNVELTAVILLIGWVCILGIIFGAVALGEFLGLPML